MWGDLKNIYIWFLIYIVASYGLLGAYDDYKKIKFKNSSGISFKIKIISQIFIAAIGILFLSHFSENADLNNLYFPFFKNLIINLGWFFIPFAAFVIVGSSNAVNLTDGLDGLATVPVILVAACFTFISYVTGNIVFSEYLQIPYIADVGEVAVFLGAVIGSCLGFLWFNAPPAKIFMGDTGSLALGGSLGAVGIITKHEIVLAITASSSEKRLSPDKFIKFVNRFWIKNFAFGLSSCLATCVICHSLRFAYEIFNFSSI